MPGETLWPRDPEHRCFGCAPRNPKGLRLVLSERDGEVVAPLCLGADYESFPGLVHGGIIGTILDEVMGRAVLSAYHQPFLTVGLRIRFAQVMETGGSYLARASITSDDGMIVKVRGQIEHAEAGLVAVAEGTFVRLTRAGLRSGPILLPELALDATGHNPEYAGEVTHE